MRPLALFMASRLVVLGAVLAAARHASTGVGAALSTWDGGWYLNVAAHGYPHRLALVGAPVVPWLPKGNVVGSCLDAIRCPGLGGAQTAFFPLYPLTIRVAHRAGLPWLGAGLLVGAVAGAVAVVLFWKLAQRLWGATTADRATALFCFFPGSFVLSMVYAEALLLALGTGCLLALLDRRWVLAGILAGLATACRPSGVALIVACAWAAGAAIAERRQWRALAAPLIAPIGLLGFFGFLWVRTGRAGAWITVQHDVWHERVDLIAWWHDVSGFVRSPFEDTNIAIAALGTLFVAVALALLIRARPPGVVLAYTLASIGLVLFASTLGARPRFVLAAFPLVAVVGRVRGTAFAALLSASAVALGALTVLSLTTRLATP